MKWKSAQRDANTARALAVVRFGHRPPARPPVTNTQTHRQDRLKCFAPLASAQCNKNTWQITRRLILPQTDRASALIVHATAILRTVQGHDQPCRKFPIIYIDHHAKYNMVVVCHTVLAYVGVTKNSGSWAPPRWDVGFGQVSFKKPKFLRFFRFLKT